AKTKSNANLRDETQKVRSAKGSELWDTKTNFYQPRRDRNIGTYEGEANHYSSPHVVEQAETRSSKQGISARGARNFWRQQEQRKNSSPSTYELGGPLGDPSSSSAASTFGHKHSHSATAAADTTTEHPPSHLFYPDTALDLVTQKSSSQSSRDSSPPCAGFTEDGRSVAVVDARAGRPPAFSNKRQNNSMTLSAPS
ncbi:unnamed protein product, partial [Amoebophrya sp. A120]